mmetsp:Transcript_4858/g.11568  ORF Transcript_4858/g.11568 Transcript_4858/m.11568 type:complete len:217 (-) Transcript_4858:1988-2638(-)
MSASNTPSTPARSFVLAEHQLRSAEMPLRKQSYQPFLFLQLLAGESRYGPETRAPNRLEQMTLPPTGDQNPGHRCLFLVSKEKILGVCQLLLRNLVPVSVRKGISEDSFQCSLCHHLLVQLPELHHPVSSNSWETRRLVSKMSSFDTRSKFESFCFGHCCRFQRGTTSGCLAVSPTKFQDYFEVLVAVIASTLTELQELDVPSLQPRYPTLESQNQ